MLAGKYIKFLILSKFHYPLSSAKRYKNLLNLIMKHKCSTIMEIGVYTGRRALEFIETASIHNPIKDITYIGFDLFEQMDKTILENQFSKMPDSQSVIEEKLKNTEAKIFLYKGWSENTLPKYISSKDSFPELDFVFIDGGHSVETITQDWDNVSKIITDKTIVVFDDYIDCPNLTEKFGCNRIVDQLDRHIFSVEILETTDSFQKDWGILKIRMVKVIKIKI